MAEAPRLVDTAHRVHERILHEYKTAELERLKGQPGAIEKLARGVVIDAVAAEKLLLSSAQIEAIVTLVRDDIEGFGPIQPFLDDPSIEEIMVNDADDVYIARDGKVIPTDCKFANDAHVRHVIDRIIRPLDRRIDDSSPMVDGRLPDGSRVNAIIPPLAIDGPALTIRKFAVRPYTMEDLVRFGTLTENMVQFLRACVFSRLNILVSGGTGSGKTTTLNTLSAFIPADERIITIEDAAELKLQQPHVVRLESRPPNLEGKGEVTIRQLVRNSLRMRPSRIIVGEVRGGEALDMLQAMNTGHDGSVTTLHANNPREALLRLETMTLMAGTDLPSRAIREQVSAAMDLIVHQSLMRDGTRKIAAVTEVQNMEGDTIVLQDVFVYEHRATTEDGMVIGAHRPTGFRPRFLSKLEAFGAELPKGMFIAQRSHNASRS